MRALKYRFAVARDHALGNLLLTALEDATGSFPEAIAICERLVNAQGHVYPSTLDHVILSARTCDGRVLDGQAVACHSKTALESVWLATDAPAVARLVVRLLHGIYALKTNLTMRRSVLHKTPNYLIEVPAQPHLADALRDMGVLSAEGGLEMGIKPALVAKPCCAAAYLRGAFLGSGFISNPKSDFHFEITVETEPLAEGLVALMERKEIVARIMQRRSSYMVYLKSGTAILEFLAWTGAHQAALSMEEERVVKSVRNDVNRMINAEMANQAKAAGAAVGQIYTIRRVVEHYGMENLPPALQDFIRLRVTYPEASLKELGERANPPLSKSAVYHRVRRIESMAAEIPE